MGTFKRGNFYHYEFVFNGERHRGTTKQRTKRKADKVEALEMTRVADEAAGIAPPTPLVSPLITEWADVYYAVASTKVGRPERIEDLLRVVLRFWGARPKEQKFWPRPGEAAPFHNLRLTDPITDPEWIVKFEQWMAERGIAGQTKNQYRSTMSEMYRLARKPAYRKRTGVTENPFDGIDRDRGGRSTVTLTVEQARAIIQAASYHVRLALAIAGLAPKLRRTNILRLEWATHLDPDLRYITVVQHKTADKTGKALVIPVTGQLRSILLDARQRNPRATHVVTYRGKPIKDLRHALRNAMEQAGVPYGRFTGATFHTLRHTAATMLAELEVPREQRKDVMGHENLATTDWYTHLRPTVEAPILEQLSGALPMVDLVIAPGWRASRKTRKRAGSSVGTPATLLSERGVNTREHETPSPTGKELVTD